MTDMMPNKPNLCVDIDGCLLDDWHRRPLIAEYGWRGYFGAMNHDQMNWAVFRVLHFFHRTHTIYLMTSRPEQYRNETLSTLLDHHVLFHHLEMRKDEDTNLDEGAWDKHKSDIDVKQEMMDKHNLTPDNVAFWMEDSDHMVKELRDKGFEVFQVRPNGERFIPK